MPATFARIALTTFALAAAAAAIPAAPASAAPHTPSPAPSSFSPVATDVARADDVPFIGYPSTRPGQSGWANVGFPSAGTEGRLDFIAPDFTTFTRLGEENVGCSITHGGTRASCPDTGSRRYGYLRLYFTVDASAREGATFDADLAGGKMTATTSTGWTLDVPFRIELVHGGWTISRPSIVQGGTGSAALEFDGPHSGPVTVKAPRGTLITGVSGGGTWTIASNGTSASAPDGTYSGSRAIALSVPLSTGAGEKSDGSVSTDRGEPFGTNNISVPLSVDVRSRTLSTLGVYSLGIAPTDGAGFAPGDRGAVVFDDQPSSGATGIGMGTGESLSYAVSLPRGIRATAPATSDDGNWKIEWSTTTNPDGSGTSVKTVTRTGPPVADAWSSRSRTILPVEAVAGLASGATVIVDFEPVPGYISAQPRAEAPVPVAKR